MVYTCPMLGFGYGGGGYLGIILGTVVWVLIIGGFVWGVFYLVNNSNNKRNNSSSMKALEVIKECYAKGEINKQEFEKMKKELR